MTVFLKKRIDSLSDLSSQLHSDLFLPLVTNLDGSDNLVLLLDRDIEALVMIRLHELLILRHRRVLFLHITLDQHHAISVRENLISWRGTIRLESCTAFAKDSRVTMGLLAGHRLLLLAQHFLI